MDVYECICVEVNGVGKSGGHICGFTTIFEAFINELETL